MNQPKKGEFRSTVYTNRPDYADFDAPSKFMAIESIIAKRLTQYPNAVCSYSGGSDSDIMLDLIERVRGIFALSPVKYVFYDTGLEMQAIKQHVEDTARKYGVEIQVVRPEKGIVTATREHGVPFISKIVSAGIEALQKKGLPLSIAREYELADDKAAKRAELKERYPKAEAGINFLCSCNSAGEPRPNIQLVISSNAFLLEFFEEYGLPSFQISSKCCDCCKKQPARKLEKDFKMVITGERRDEGGMRSVPRSDSTSMCFQETSYGKYRLRPLFYVSDADKAWYKEWYGLRYSDAYEIYGLKRTGCCGCSIAAGAVNDLKRIGAYEPKLEVAARRVFGQSYELREAYNAFKRDRMEAKKIAEAKSKEKLEGQEVMDGYG